MTQREFTDAVLAAMKRATSEERAAVRRELEEHLEDHIDAIRDSQSGSDSQSGPDSRSGSDSQSGPDSRSGSDGGAGAGGQPARSWLEAEAEAVAAMGDPREVGQALNRQLSRGWLWLGRIAVLLAAVLCAQMLFSLGLLLSAWNSLTARIYPNMESQLANAEISERVNLRMDAGNDVLRVFRVTAGEAQEGCRVVEVALCAYDRWPFGIVASGLWNWMSLGPESGWAVNQEYGSLYQRDDGAIQGEQLWSESEWYRHSYSNYGAAYWHGYTVVPEGSQSVVLTYERYGTANQLEIPLPVWEAAS